MYTKQILFKKNFCKHCFLYEYIQKNIILDIKNVLTQMIKIYIIQFELQKKKFCCNVLLIEKKPSYIKQYLTPIYKKNNGINRQQIYTQYKFFCEFVDHWFLILQYLTQRVFKKPLV